MIELEGRDLTRFLDAMHCISTERKKGVLEFDGIYLKLSTADGFVCFEKIVVNPDYFYSEEVDIDDIEPFRKRVNPRCFKDCLKEVYEYVNEDEDLLRMDVKLKISTEKDKVYIDLVDKWKCSAYDMNIICGCILK